MRVTLRTNWCTPPQLLARLLDRSPFCLNTPLRHQERRGPSLTGLRSLQLQAVGCSAGNAVPSLGPPLLLRVLCHLRFLTLKTFRGSRTLVSTVPALFAQGERAHGCYASSSTRTMVSHRWIPVDYHVALGFFPKSCEEVQDLRRSRWLQGSCTIVRLRGRFPEFLNQDVGRFVSLHSDACPTDSVQQRIAQLKVACEVYFELSDRPVPAVDCNLEVVALSSLWRNPRPMYKSPFMRRSNAHVTVVPSD